MATRRTRPALRVKPTDTFKVRVELEQLTCQFCEKDFVLDLENDSVESMIKRKAVSGCYDCVEITEETKKRHAGGTKW